MSIYTEAVERNLEGLEAVSTGGYSACPDCDIEEWDDDGPEPFFSWSACETCGSTLGGDRHPAHALIDGELIHLNTCVDCVTYLANGDEPENWS